MPESSAFEIRLDQYLKLSGLAGTGGQAKLLIQDGQVLVNGAVETRRRSKLHPGDVVQCGGQRRVVAARGEDAFSGEGAGDAFSGSG